MLRREYEKKYPRPEGVHFNPDTGVYDSYPCFSEECEIYQARYEGWVLAFDYLDNYSDDEEMTICWRCSPAFCKCPPPESEIDKLRAERFIAERMLIEERTRRRLSESEETARRRSAEEVISEILEATGSGEITLPFVIECANRHMERYGVARNESSAVALIGVMGDGG